jgi:hypothetical protein
LFVFLPNFLWQVRHDFISVHFLQHIHARDISQGRANGFLRDQFIICTNFFAAPLWIAGLIYFLLDRRYRMLGWMYCVVLALFLIGKGRGYYAAGAYPMLFAMGAVAGERWLSSMNRGWRMKRGWRIAIEIIFFTGVTAWGLFAFALLVPIATGGPLKQFALKNNGDLREEIGWDELVKTVAGIRDSLPSDQQASVGVIAGNYGEAGAIEILGPAYHLPPPISMTNSAWLRGYPSVPPTTLIVLGFSKEAADSRFTSCRLAGHNANSQGVENEESKYHPDIFVCGPPQLPWPDYWSKNQRYG